MTSKAGLEVGTSEGGSLASPLAVSDYEWLQARIVGIKPKAEPDPREMQNHPDGLPAHPLPRPAIPAMRSPTTAFEDFTFDRF